MFKKLLLSLTFIITFTMSSFAASIAVSEKDDVEKFLNSVIDNAIVNIAKNKDKNKKLKEFDKLFLSNIDMEYITKFLLGRELKQATKQETENFNKAFKEFNLYSWILKISLYSDEKIEIKSITSAKKDDQAFVNTSVKSDDGESVNLQFRVRKTKSSEYKISDISVAEVSMLLNYKKEFSAILQKSKDSGENSVVNLTKFLENKNKELKDKYMKD